VPIALTNPRSGAGQLGFFEAPQPWGPWATIAYYDDLGGLNEVVGEALGLAFPSKWISADGRSMWAVFSGTGLYDSFNVAHATLTVQGSPVFTAPADGTVFSAGDTVTAQGAGSSLTWSVSLLKEGGPPIATATGGAITSLVPSTLLPDEVVRITLSNPRGSVHRDFSVTSASALPEVTIHIVSTGAVFSVVKAEKGTQAYTDRDYYFSDLSPRLAGGWLVQGPNNDKGVTVAKYLKFALDRPGVVSVCYSGLARSLPVWLTDGTWTRTSDACAVTDGVATPRVVFRKSIPTGSITLGGNCEAPANCQSRYSDYLAIVDR
jgi:hypothetical protein